MSLAIKWSKIFNILDFFNENAQIANELEITLQYLTGDQDEDVQSYIKKQSFNSEDKNELQTGQSSQEDVMNNDSITYDTY